VGVALEEILFSLGPDDLLADLLLFLKREVFDLLLDFETKRLSDFFFFIEDALLTDGDLSITVPEFKISLLGERRLPFLSENLAECL
jgi:hypothetical protein